MNTGQLGLVLPSTQPEQGGRGARGRPTKRPRAGPAVPASRGRQVGVLRADSLRARSDVPVARGVWGVPGRARALTRGSAPEQAGAAAHTHDDTYTRPQDGLLRVIERIVS